MAASRGKSIDGPCAVCGCSDGRVLGRAELVGQVVILCANDRAILGRLELTLAELRAEAAPRPAPPAAPAAEENRAA